MSKQGIAHDTAAQLLGIAPTELAALVRDGHVRRIDVNAYAVPTLVQDYIAHLNAMANRSERHPTQKEAGEHLDLSDRSIRDIEVQLNLRGIDYTLSQLRIAYIRKLREEAAGRATAGDLDLATERARQARAMADKYEMQNAVARKELAPVVLLEQVLARTGSKAARILDTIPGEVRRRVPQLTADDIAAVAKAVAKARNMAAAMRLADLDAPEDDDLPLADEMPEAAA